MHIHYPPVNSREYSDTKISSNRIFRPLLLSKDIKHLILLFDINSVKACILSEKSEKVLCQFNNAPAAKDEKKLLRKSAIFQKYISNINVHLSSWKLQR